MSTETIRQQFIQDIKTIVKVARGNVYRAINTTMVAAYWNIGQRIVEEEQDGKHRAEYGKYILRELADALNQEFGKGFDERELRRMRQFYLTFPIRDSLRPELLPADSEGKIAQKTEHFVGPYELHDFFLHRMLRYGDSPKRIYFIAQQAFANIYSPEEILKWLKVFYKRFFAQQFKRSCMPDGPKVGSINLSPRGDWRMSSDVVANVWLEELES